MAISKPSKKTLTRRQLILQNRLSRKYLPSVYRSLMTGNKYFADIVKAEGPEAALMKITRDPYINETIGPVIMQLYQEAAKWAYPRTKITKGIVIPLFGFVKNVLQYFRQFLLSKVVLPISNTTKQHIERVLRDGIANGDGQNAIVAKIMDPALTKRRARTIVRTESVRAMNYAQLSAADDSDYEVTKEWIDVEDNRTRPTHRHSPGVAGEVRALNEAFSNGLMYPGDPDGSAAETINCRCTLGYAFARDANGKLIRKRPIAVTPEEREQVRRVLAN